MAASNNGRTEAVHELLESGANPNMQDHVCSKSTKCEAE